jgi:outer membrane protein assembly factor BamB
MAYDSNNLSALTYANGFTLWHYKTDDDAAVVDTAGYFNDAAGMLRVGDFIFGNFDLDGTPSHGVMAVVSNTAGVVDVADANAFGNANTD